jgi:hypothetical protein
MKRIYLSVIIFFAIVFSAQSQEKRVNLYGGYVFDDGIDQFNDYNSYVNATVKGGFQYGASIEFIAPSEIGLELLYIGQSTTMPVSFNSSFSTGTRNGTYDVNLNYALVSLNKYSRSGKMEGYGGLMMGCLFSNSDNIGNKDSLGTNYGSISSSSTHFSWGLKLGLNYWVGNNVGLKFQAQFLSTSQAYGGGTYYGGYYGYYDYYSYINMFQWNFSTGLVFRFGGVQ